MFNLKKYSLTLSNDWMPVWIEKLSQVVKNKIDELKKQGVIGVEYHSFIKKIVPPAGGPIDMAKPYEKKEATEEYLKILSSVISKLPEGYRGFIFEPSESGIGYESHSEP